MTPPPGAERRIVVLGVSGSGKTTVGEALAARLGSGFVDADDLHPPASVAKMAAGIPLTDEDREPWLRAVAGVLAEARAEGRGLVVACSALRRRYRDQLRVGDPELLCLLLDGSRELLESRLRARRGHFMPADLLDSQLATLEPLVADERGTVLDLAVPVADLVEAAARAAGDARPRLS